MNGVDVKTASIAFENYEIKFLNSFFDPKFAKYKDIQINLKNI